LHDRNVANVIESRDDALNRAGGAMRPSGETLMNTNRKLVRWGTLAVLVAMMSGCCIAPWGGRYYRGGHEGGGYYGGGNGGYHGGNGYYGGGGGGGYHH
jgi:hypothetical protein